VSDGTHAAFDFEAMAPEARYRLLVSTVVPRPIAWVVTRSPETGVVNAAPYSFFNVMGDDPPVVAIGVLGRGGGYKDTSRNILEAGEFVVCLVPEELAPAMNQTCVDAPPGVSELELAGLSAAPSAKVAPPRIAESPVALECVRLHALELGPRQVCVIGRVVAMHIAKRVLTGDPARPRVDTPALRMVGRMHGSGTYARTGDLFDLTRPGPWTGQGAG
jgi:flavin reductase (DIM6/NTAB) family NADH-FMN oxidoreductase RutF